MNILALLPNLAGPDMLIIFFIVLILFGAKKLPELAKGLGQAVREFSKAKDDMSQEFHRASTVNEAHLPPPASAPPASAPAAPGATAPSVSTAAHPHQGESHS